MYIYIQTDTLGEGMTGRAPVKGSEKEREENRGAGRVRKPITINFRRPSLRIGENAERSGEPPTLRASNFNDRPRR